LFVTKFLDVGTFRARPLTLHPHLHCGCKSADADADAGTMASAPFKLQIRMKNHAGTATLPA